MSNLAAEQQPLNVEQTVQSLVDDTSILISPPDIYLKINEMLAENAASVDQFATVISPQH